MNLTVGECSEQRLGEALSLARRCFQKNESSLQSKQGRAAFARRFTNNRHLREQIEQGDWRLFAAFDGERMCGLSLMEGNHIRYFCIEGRYRRTDAAPLLLDYIRTVFPALQADAPLSESEQLALCGFTAAPPAEADGWRYIPMHAAPRELTHELWDLRDELGEPTGRYASRDQYRTLRAGDYMLAVHVYLYTPDGRFLIQKRSEKKDVLPGIWDMTGGAAKAGEDGRTAAIRETLEEVGLSLCPERLYLSTRLKRKRSFVELWFAKTDIDLRQCRLQEGEVDEVKLVSRQGMADLIGQAKHRDHIYKRAAIRAIKQAR